MEGSELFVAILHDVSSGRLAVLAGKFLPAKGRIVGITLSTGNKES
jgi:hypothetical protein